MTENELVEGFERCTLPNTAFHHPDHVHVVWSYLRGLPLTAALDRFRNALKRFAAHNGKPGLYHETITCAYVILVNERMQANPASDWENFCGDNPDLLTWRPSILDRYYQPETLQTDFARRVFVFPDRALH
jgi:hypothetical protein